MLKKRDWRKKAIPNRVVKSIQWTFNPEKLLQNLTTDGSTCAVLYDPYVRGYPTHYAIHTIPYHTLKMPYFGKLTSNPYKFIIVFILLNFNCAIIRYLKHFFLPGGFFQSYLTGVLNSLSLWESKNAIVTLLTIVIHTKSGINLVIIYNYLVWFS